jgi:hypothetical protein
MKKTILALALVLAALLAVFAQAQEEKDAKKVETINLMGKDYTVSKVLPDEIIGIYQYEEKSEPEIEIKKDGTGFFQPHKMPKIPIRIWIDVDEKGVPRREVGIEQRYRYTLLIQYGEGGGGNYKADSYDLLDVTMLKDQGIAMILGERIRRLK